MGATQLKSPRDIKFDPSGNLYVSDQGNNRVQKFMIQIPPNCTTSTSKYEIVLNSILIVLDNYIHIYR